MKQFKTLAKQVLELDSIIPSGKLQGLLLKDCIDEHHEYLIWLNKFGTLNYSDRAIEAIASRAGYVRLPSTTSEPTILTDIPF